MQMNTIAAFLDDVGVDPNLLSAEQAASYLDHSINDMLGEIESSSFWTIIASRSTSDDTVQRILQEIYLEIFMYQPASIEGAITAIAQMPRQMPVTWFGDMLHHQVDEFDHGEMALRDYIGFGGNEQFARSRPQSPSAFAIAAVWNMIAHKRDPFLYLGAVYLFDALTPLITQKASAVLSGRQLSAKGLEFISHHAVADIEHADQIRKLIVDVIDYYPDKTSSILYGFEYFRHVYPLPCWNAALQRAMNRRDLSMAAE